MTTNNGIIEKTAMTLNDLSTGGRMNRQQANTFLRMVQDQPTIIRESRFIPMESDRRKIEKIGFGQRILRAAEEGVALAPGERAKPTTGTVNLDAQEVIAEVNITYDTLENNIEGGNLRNTIMQMIAERASLDLEELIVNGDTDSSDSYLALINGLKKQATSNLVDFGGNEVSTDLFKKMYKAVPAKYLRNPAAFRYYTSYGAELEYKDLVAKRATAGGDSALEGARQPGIYGVPVRGIAMLQPEESEAGNVSQAFLTHPQNIVIGMPRNIQIEVDRDIRERKFIIVLTAKIDVQFEEEKAVAKATNILED